MRLFIIENDNSILAEMQAESMDMPNDEALKVIKPFIGREIQTISLHFHEGFKVNEGEDPMDGLDTNEPHTFKIQLR